MPTISMGRTFEDTVNSIFCRKCSDKGYERHHVLYSPVVIVLLCRICHKKITHLNGKEARNVPRGARWRKLNNKARLRVWNGFIDG